jgi:copper chaperone CopZ
VRKALPFLALLLLAAPAFAEDGKPAPAAPKEEPKLETRWVETTGVDAKRTGAVVQAMASVRGVSSAQWTVEGTEAKVVRVVGTASDEMLAKAAKDAGATTSGVVPTEARALQFVKKLHCGGCAVMVDEALRAVKGVKDVAVAEDKMTVTVVYDTRTTKAADLVDALAKAKRPAQGEGAPIP